MPLQNILPASSPAFSPGLRCRIFLPGLGQLPAVEAGPGLWAKRSRLPWDLEGGESCRTLGQKQPPRAQGWSRTSIRPGQTSSSSSPMERNCCHFERGWRKFGLGRRRGLISK